MTVMRNGKEYIGVGIAFNKDTEGWYVKYRDIIFNFIKDNVHSMPSLYDRETDERVTNIVVFNGVNLYNWQKYYLKGVLRFYLPVELKEAHERFAKNNFKIGPNKSGENPELDKIFSDLDDHEPVIQAG